MLSAVPVATRKKAKYTSPFNVADKPYGHDIHHQDNAVIRRVREKEFEKTAEQNRDKVVHLNEYTFYENIAKHRLSLVKFYDPNDPEYKDGTRPQFKAAAHHLHVQNQSMAQLMSISCFTSGQTHIICNKYQVKRYPTYLLFRNDSIDTPEVYRGDPYANSLVWFVKKRYHGAYFPLTSSRELDLFYKDTYVGVLGFLEEGSEQLEEFTKLAFALHDEIDFAVITNATLLASITKRPMITLIRQFDVNILEYKGSLSRASFETFLAREMFPLIADAENIDIDEYKARGLPIVWVTLNLHRKSHLVEKVAREVAKEFRGELSFLIVNANNRALLGKAPPPDILIQHGKDFYVLQGEVTEESLRSHCHGVLDGTIEPLSSQVRVKKEL